MIEISGVHGYTAWINLTGTPTKQDDTHNAHAKCDDGTMHGYVHNLLAFPWSDEEHELVIPTN